MNPVTYFEIPTEDTSESRQFYSNVFGWSFREASNDYWITQSPENNKGISGAIMKRNHPDQPLTITIEVENLDATIKKIEANGGTIVVPKMAVSGFGWVVFFKDPDDNIIGTFKPDSNT